MDKLGAAIENAKYRQRKNKNRTLRTYNRNSGENPLNSFLLRILGLGWGRNIPFSINIFHQWILEHIQLVVDAQLKECYRIKKVMTKIKGGRRLMKALGCDSTALCPPSHRCGPQKKGKKKSICGLGNLVSRKNKRNASCDWYMNTGEIYSNCWWTKNACSTWKVLNETWGRLKLTS